MNSVCPADTYMVVNQTILTEIDKKTLISLYEPIIGPTATSLYLTLWSDLDKLEIVSKDYTHHHLMTILKSSLSDIVKARQALEALGLLKSFVKKDENISEYLYELYSPISPYEFFNHPILGVLLLNNIGEIEYNNLLQYYKKQIIKKDDYEEITSSMNNTFKSVTPREANDEIIRKQNKNGINLDNVIDFELLEMSLPKGMINSKTLNKKTKELINQLAFIYNVDTIKMSEILRLVIDELGLINKDKLRDAVRKNYEYNNNGSLPTLVFRTQPEHLKSPEGDTSNRGKMIFVFENTKPYDFLKNKNKGIKPTIRDLKLIEHLAIDFDLPAGVINVLIDYAIRVNDGKLNQKYLETIASDWSRKGIKTVGDAMNVAKRGYKQVEKKSYDSKPKREVKVPTWMYEDNKSEEMSPEELNELENMFSEFR
ncbi:MAG: DnaD domain protein [Erysipelotrichales bacterium]|nr:DnaD domain protein [Erysipelotrichales bacterium]